MHRAVLLFTTVVCLYVVVTAQQSPPARSNAPTQVPERRGFIVPSDVNVRIDPDVRTMVVMAALNVARFDYETGGQPLSPARVELRKDLTKLDPQVRSKLAAFYQSHRRQGVDEGADAARYAALSMLMTQPPAF